ncbi:hypothetical protein KQI49_09065 [Virgibacillus sp. MSJ-26]|uniref:hypothetical protein n=1 Tax=Virgibacillus sp. MSJ-26 TaxID=2841522 RepID=UPI001C1158A8|nr:hypothetical protein [Virgibacillus sp. MSJ-26]MBU5466970.1 hypothetical protein [Virgibacillus sp. MSJ-26]
MKEYKYFVVYIYAEGWGNIDVTLTEPVQTIEDIRSLEQAITENQQLEQTVCVQNFIAL